MGKYHGYPIKETIFFPISQCGKNSTLIIGKIYLVKIPKVPLKNPLKNSLLKPLETPITKVGVADASGQNCIDQLPVWQVNNWAN